MYEMSQNEAQSADDGGSSHFVWEGEVLNKVVRVVCSDDERPWNPLTYDHNQNISSNLIKPSMVVYPSLWSWMDLSTTNVASHIFSTDNIWAEHQDF